MTKPSDFSPAQALEIKNNGDIKRPGRGVWMLRAAGVAVLITGWLVVALNDFGEKMFIVDTVAFAAMAVFAFTAAAVSRTHAVNQERKIRLRLLVHNMELENMSIRDELTQLFNRRYLFERLERELGTAKGFQRPLAFIAIEIKSVEQINYTCGYDVGDRLLAAFGQFLLDYSRATDIPARMGGNKFGIILPDTSKRGAHTMVERLTQSLAAASLMDDREMDAAIEVSFGVCGYPWSGDTIDAIVRQAEIERDGHLDQTGGDGVGGDHERPVADEIPAAFRGLDESF